MTRSNDPNAVTVNRVYHLITKGVDLNVGPKDTATFVGLPAKYRVRRCVIYDASGSLGASAATLGLNADSGGGTPALVTAQTLTSLTLAVNFLELTLTAEASAKYRTESILWLYNGVRHGSAMTISAMLEVVDLTG